MKIVAMGWRSVLIGLVTVLPAAGCSGDVPYEIAVRNHTGEGVIIYPAYAGAEDESATAAKRWRINPGIPGVGADIERIPAFELFDVPMGPYEEKDAVEMPAELRIRWQRAKLDNCQRSRESHGYKDVNGRKEELDDGRLYTRKSRCDWEAYGAVREFSVSREKVRSTDAYKKVESEGINLGGPATLTVYFIFEGEEVVIDTGWGSPTL